VGRQPGGAGATRAAAEAGRLDRAAVALTIASGVADTYFQALSARDRLRIARANLGNARRVLAIVEARVASGAASELELAQQRTQVANQAATLPALEQQERQTGERAGAPASAGRSKASPSPPARCVTCGPCRCWPACRATC
jgi:hypothetical protein